MGLLEELLCAVIFMRRNCLFPFLKFKWWQLKVEARHVWLGGCDPPPSFGWDFFPSTPAKVRPKVQVHLARGAPIHCGWSFATLALQAPHARSLLRSALTSASSPGGSAWGCAQAQQQCQSNHAAAEGGGRIARTVLLRTVGPPWSAWAKMARVLFKNHGHWQFHLLLCLLKMQTGLVF